MGYARCGERCTVAASARVRAGRRTYALRQGAPHGPGGPPGADPGEAHSPGPPCAAHAPAGGRAPKGASGNPRAGRLRQPLEARAPAGGRQALASSARRRSRKARSAGLAARSRARRYAAAASSAPSQPAEEIRPGRVQQVVALQLAPHLQVVEQLEPAGRALGHRHGHGAVELHHRPRPRGRQQLVERSHARPVGLGRRSSPPRSAPGASTGPPRPRGRPAPCPRRSRRGAKGAVLVLQQHQLATGVRAGVAARVVEHHQRQQAGPRAHRASEGPAHGPAVWPRRRARDAQRCRRWWPGSPR